MKFLELELRNFGIIGEASFSLVGNGLVLIDGRNHDTPDHGSNGAGKTSLVPDALSWALFGRTTRGVAGDAVVRAGAEDGASVRVLLKSQGTRYEVTRWRKDLKEGNRIRLIQLAPDKDLTCSTNPDTEKRIQRLLGVQFDVWMYCIVLGQGLSYRFSSLRDQQRCVLLETIIAVTDFDRARTAAKDEASRIEVEAAGLSGASDELALSLETQQKAVTSSRAALQYAKDAADQAPEEYTQRLPHLRTRLSEAEDVQAGLQRRVLADAQHLDSIRHKLSEAQRQHLRSDSAISRCRDEIGRTEKLLAAATAGTCGTCGQAIAERRSDALQATWKKELHEARTKLEEARRTGVEWLLELRELRRNETDVQRSLAKLEETHDQRKDECARLRAEIRQLESSQEVPKVIDTLRAELKQQKEALEKLQLRHQEVSTAYASSQEELSYWRWWVTGFQQLRLDMLRRVVTFLSSRLQHYCSELSGGTLSASVSLHEKRVSSGVGLEVSLDVANHSGTYEGASGGERDRIDLAMAFALHDVAMTTSGFSSNVLVADEVGGFIDPPGVARAIDLLRKKAEKLDSVFVISQNQEFKSATYDQRWVVSRKGGVSTMKRVGSR